MIARTALVIAALAAACRGKQSAGVEDLAPKLEPIRTAHHLPALGAAVWRHGQLVAAGMTGLRKWDDPSHPATLDDLWHLGSDTKAMTATLVAIYVDRGKVHWNDTIAQLFPGETIDPGYANVTLDQLLQHRSGAPAGPPLALAHDLFEHGDEPGARKKLVAAVLGSPPKHAAGTFDYSNVGYTIIGAALERATGQSWEDLMRQDLFGPLHMTSCGFGAPGDAAKVDQPWGHVVHATWADPPQLDAVSPAEPHADNPAAIGPAGTVHCSLADWGKFLAIHAAPTTTLVSAGAMGHLHIAPEIDREHYMAGWMFQPIGPGIVQLGHEGSNTKWHAIALVVPANDVAVAVVTNRIDEDLYKAVKPLFDGYLKGK
jgi:CubicO group peptidase (beta-lactamase class C family)